MSLHDIFMQRAALKHQNMLNSDTTGIVLQSLAEGVAKGIQDEQARVQAQRDEERKFKNTLELIKAKYSNDRTIPVSIVDTETGELKEVGQIPKGSKVYTAQQKKDPISVRMIDPLTGEIKDLGTAPVGSKIYKGVLSPEQMSQRAIAEGEAKAISTDIQSTQKLAGAVKRLALLNRQYAEALPTGDNTPIEQRISGATSSWAAQRGLINNPKLVALRQNIRPIAINMIRAFGEVGNLSESEQQGAIDAVDQAGLTEEERAEKTRQFIEYAIAGARPESIKSLTSREDIRGILESFGVNVDGSNSDKSNNLKSFSTPEEADASGLPKGTIVDVGGRRYQI